MGTNSCSRRRSAPVLAALLGSAAMLLFAAGAGCYTQIAVPPRVSPSGGMEQAETYPGADGDGVVSRTEDGLGFTLRVQPTRFRAGESIVIEIVLDNLRSSPYAREFPSGCNVAFEVRSERNEFIGPFRACNAYSSEILLAPGERRVYRYEWDDAYFGAESPLEPGRYWVTGGFVDGERLLPAVPPVAIEVLP